VIVPGGVLVEQELASRVARILAAEARRDPAGDSPALRRLVFELAEVAERASEPGRALDVGPTGWSDTRAAADQLQVSPRTVRRWATTGRVRARREGWRWLIRT
jgi:hypothetical protein